MDNTRVGKQDWGKSDHFTFFCKLHWITYMRQFSTEVWNVLPWYQDDLKFNKPLQNVFLTTTKVRK